MRTLGSLVATIGLAAVYLAAPAAAARVVAPRPAYEWAAEAHLVVAGRVERVGDSTAVLTITSTFAGEAGGARLEFEPIHHPECGGSPDPDVAPGDEVALFLVRGKDRSAWTVLDHGYAKLDLGDARRGLVRSTLSKVGELIATVRTEDVVARDRAMIRMARSEDGLLRWSACGYIRDALGVATLAPPPLSDGAAPYAERQREHLGGVRRLAEELGTLLQPGQHADARSAALKALADAECAPPTAFESVLALVESVSRYSTDARNACEVLARYVDPRALAALLRAARAAPFFLEFVGSSQDPLAGTALLVELRGGDPSRRRWAIGGAARRIARSRDPDLEEVLLQSLRQASDPTWIRETASALRTARPAETAGILLDLLGGPRASREVEDEAAPALHDLLSEKTATDGVREAIVRRQAELIARLDAKAVRSVHVIRLLHDVGTEEAAAALKRAAASYPDPALRAEADARRRFPCGH